MSPMDVELLVAGAIALTGVSAGGGGLVGVKIVAARLEERVNAIKDNTDRIERKVDRINGQILDHSRRIAVLEKSVFE